MYQKILEYYQKNINFAYHIGLDVTELSAGYCVSRLELTQKLLNPGGTLHGGAMFTMADTTCGLAASTHGYRVVTQNANINYFKPVSETFVTCTAKSVRVGKRSSYYEAEIRNEAGELAAKAGFTFFHLGEIAFGNL